MRVYPRLSNAEIFALYAGDDVTKWLELVGQRVRSRTFGWGSIVDAISGETGVLVRIQFDSDTEGLITPCHVRHLCDPKRYPELTLPPDHPIQFLVEDEEGEEERLRSLEVTASAQFADLKAKYAATNFGDQDPTSPLYPILIKIEEGERLEEVQIKWLEAHYLFETLRIYFTSEFWVSGDPWHLVKLSKYARRQGAPHVALFLTDHLLDHFLEQGDAKLKSAILTTRGAALRDYGDLDGAETCAREAMRQDGQSYHPYSLLGAIYCQRGDPELGDEFFEHARQRGASAQHQERQIRSALDGAGLEERRRVAQYLLCKDPERYAWAIRYLPEQPAGWED